MKNIPSFFIGPVVGALIGAIVALLYAPSNGEELRSRIGQTAVADREKLQAGYEKARYQAQERIGKMQHHQEDQAGPEEGKEERIKKS